MEKTIVYRRDGKFGNEFFIALENLRIIQCKETPKAYACGSFNTKEQYIDGWIAKSLCKEIDGKICCPTWVLKWTRLTERIIKDYYHEEFDVREFSNVSYMTKDGNIHYMSDIPSTDHEEDCEEEWPDAKKYIEEKHRQVG